MTTGNTDERALVPYNLDDFQAIAKAKLPRDLYEYLASGGDDEQTLSQNKAAFKQWFLRPRVLRRMTHLNTETTLYGQTLSMPVFVSPAGVMALCDPTHGECATARACVTVVQCLLFHNTLLVLLNKLQKEHQRRTDGINRTFSKIDA
jgi:hypothetical protein